MEIFGVGPLEFLLILVMALVILGPRDMVSTARKMGQWVYRVVRSPTWQAILATTQEIRELPQQIVRDSGIGEAMDEVKQTVDEAKGEISAATSEVSSELQAASYTAANEMQAASASFNAGLNPETGALSSDVENEPGPADANVPDEDRSTETEPPQAEITTPSTPLNSYLSDLEGFAQALGQDIPPRAQQVPPAEPPMPQIISADMIAQALTQDYGRPSPEPTPPAWAEGVSPGLESADDMSTRLQNQMDEIAQKIKRLESQEPTPG